MKSYLISALASLGLLASISGASAQSITDPTPVAEQVAVDGLNFKLSVLGGAFQRNVLGSASNAMFVASIATPIPFVNKKFAAQLDLAAGGYDGGFTSAAGGLHLFWRDPSIGMLGIYGDWGYVDPEHAGRTGVEAAIYNDRWSLDIFAGVQYGQHVYTDFVDEVDLSYYFTDNTKGSIGHRLTSRGHVANISFEHMFSDGPMEGLSVFGELEGGDDNYVAGWGGIRWSFGTGTSTSLIERDRKGSTVVRIPRNLASVTQCGVRDVPLAPTSWRSTMTTLCASEDEINAVSSTGIAKLGE
jgi:hypothetical protein